MTDEKKIELLEEMLELDPGSINASMDINEVENWDSMAQLSLIVLIDEECGKRVTGDDIKNIKTVQDVLDLMEC